MAKILSYEHKDTWIDRLTGGDEISILSGLVDYLNGYL